MRGADQRNERGIPGTVLRRWLPAVLVGSLTAQGMAQTPSGTPTPTPIPIPMPVTPPMPMPMSTAPMVTPMKPTEPEKTVSFMFEDKPWGQVLDWFAKESGLVRLTSVVPTGGVTIKPPDPNKRYTMREVVDLLNEAMAPKYILIRRSQTFIIHPADEAKLPPDMVPRITLDDLGKKGDTEVVQLTFPLKTLNADEMVPYVTKLKSNFGEVNPFGSNALILQDTAKNLRRIIHDLEQLEDEKRATDSLTYVCKFIRASSAAETLRTLLSDANTQVTATNPQQPAFGGFNQFQPQMPPTDPRGRNSGISGGIAARFKSVAISVMEQTNTILITGPADKIAAAQKFLKDIDVGTPGMLPRLIGPPEIRTYAVPGGSAADVATTLTNVYKSSTLVRITALPNSNSIMVYAPPADHFEIAAQLRGTQKIENSTTI
ncbi:MAG: secretin N-terminal domain-containing protein, partial [Gemmataceae bacterium]